MIDFCSSTFMFSRTLASSGKLFLDEAGATEEFNTLTSLGTFYR